MRGQPPKYPFREMQIGEIRSVPLPIPAGLMSWEDQRKAGEANCRRLAGAIRQWHFKHPERFVYTTTISATGPVAHIRRIS